MTAKYNQKKQLPLQSRDTRAVLVP